jgi:hypothetical protein
VLLKAMAETGQCDDRGLSERSLCPDSIDRRRNVSNEIRRSIYAGLGLFRGHLIAVMGYVVSKLPPSYPRRPPRLLRGIGSGQCGKDLPQPLIA